MLDDATDPALVATITREMHGLVYVKTRGKARAHVEHAEVHRGLKGLRAVKQNLFRMDAKKSKMEYDQLTSLDPIKDSDTRMVATLIATCHAELARLGKLDAEHVRQASTATDPLQGSPRRCQELHRERGGTGPPHQLRWLQQICNHGGPKFCIHKAEKPAPLLGNVNDDAPEAAAAPTKQQT